MTHFFQKLRAFWALRLLTAMCLVSASSWAAEPLPVTASFSILGDLVRVVGGDRVNVTTLVGPNEDAHVFEPTPSDAKSILHAQLLVINGLGFEPWAQKLAQSAGYKGAMLIATQGIKPRNMAGHAGHAGHNTEADPHAWQNPANVVIYVRNIAQSLTQLDPAGAATYQRNSDAYIAELVTLDNWAKAQFAALPSDKRRVITPHDAFGYFAEHYQVTFLAPQGLSTDAQPSAKQVAQLIRQIKREKIKAVFVENMGNPKLLSQITNDAGITLGAKLYVDALSGPADTGASYLKMMQHNVTQLVAGMQRN